MQFEKDIFISYAHIDDESLIENQRGWISDFHRALEIRLAQLLGRRPVIWRDPSLQGNHLFDKQIVDQFAKVAIMISILSPRYVKSEWCLREVNEFYNACQQNIGFSVNNHARLFKIIKTPVRIDLHPEIIQNILGYEFYSSDPHTGRVKEFSQVFGQQTELAYWEKLDDLAHDICNFLESLEQQSGVGSAVNTTIPASITSTSKKTKKIFLAESSYDTQEFRDSIKRELQDHGYILLPDKQLPLIAPHLQTEINMFLEQSDLCIHLIGSNYGVVPEGIQKSLVEVQNHLAASLSAATGKQRLIWIPEGVDPKDERQIAFIDKLRAGVEGIAGADIVESSLEDFKGIIADKLKALEAVKPPEVKQDMAQDTAAEAGSKMIYLICDMQDIDEIRDLEDYLFNSGYEVITPIFEGEESQIREDHIENLKSCSGAIIFYGKANELWLRSKMRDFLKINGYGRSKPLDLKMVYISTPDTPGKQRFRTLEAEVINGIAGVPSDKLKTALSKI